MDWAPLIREYGLPLSMLFLFGGAILTGRLYASVALDAIVALWAKRVEDWQTRALAAEARLDEAFPLLAAATDELIKSRHPKPPPKVRRPIRRPPGARASDV